MKYLQKKIAMDLNRQSLAELLPDYSSHNVK